MTRVWVGEEFSDMKETEMEELLHLQRGMDGDRGSGTKSVGDERRETIGMKGHKALKRVCIERLLCVACFYPFNV